MAPKIRKAAGTANPAGATYKDARVPDPALATEEYAAQPPTPSYQPVSQTPLLHQAGSINTPQSRHQRSYPDPEGPNVHNARPSPHLGNGSFIQHQPPYGPPPQDAAYYASHPSPRSTHSAPGHYPSSDTPDPMAAAAHMQRPPYPPIYHTPQSNSPTSVASPPSHDQHGRSMYGQQPPQLTQPIYGYPHYPPMNQVHQSPYAPHPSQQQQQHPHQLTSQPMLMHQNPTAQMHPQNLGHHPSIASSPRMKMEPPQQQQQQQQQQQPPQQQQVQPNRGPMMPQQQPASGPGMNAPNLHQPPASGSGANSNAAPGPIPATTPLVVRQDGNGVQWIAFEYSRDRVKMEYTIRCDVESVNVDNLSSEFKTENCVYPRACCGKDQYKGNRLNYETECNAVGWALAELNPCLRSKRGLIQRAVDSWRNSNQDPRLRSRRVRRQAKLNNRSKVSAQQPSQMAGSGVPGSAGMPGPSPGMAAPGTRPPANMALGNAQQLHHHHAHPDGNVPGQGDVSAETGYPSISQQPHRPPSVHAMSLPPDVRQAQVFGSYSSYPVSAPSTGPSMAPPLHATMNPLNRPGGNTTTVATKEREERGEEDSALFGDVPEAKRRKFILVPDTQRDVRVRVKVSLDQVEMSEIPDSFREKNSVHPRSYFPVQMQLPPPSSRGNRFVDDDDTEDDNGWPTIGRTAVPVHVLDADSEHVLPKLTRSKKRKEQNLNEIGYRMAWSQMRVFDGRPIFLQRALDAYRNKQRSMMVTAGQETSAIPSHLETRVGKRRWNERSSGPLRTATPPPAPSQ